MSKKIKYRSHIVSQASNNHVMICKDSEMVFHAEVDENHDVRLVWNLTTYGDDDISFSNEEIKSIVTKEQFESMKYEVK